MAGKNGISIRPSEMVEGGAVPVDQQLTWKNPKFELYDYNGKAPQVTAAHINLVSVDGQDHEQYYSVGDPSRFVPSADGKKLVAVGPAQALSKSSNFYLLMNALVSAGFPESNLSDDFSTLDGLVAYHIALVEPKRSGLARPATEGEQREKTLSVPSKIISMPGEAKAGKKGTAAKKGAADTTVVAAAVEFVGKQLADAESITRQELAAAAFRDLADDPNRDAIAGMVFNPTFAAALVAAGYTVSGEDISK